VSKKAKRFLQIKTGRFEDTNKLFVPPEHFDYHVTTEVDIPQWHAEVIARLIKPKKNYTSSSRYQEYIIPGRIN
jgi:hypothetical protein